MELGDEVTSKKGRHKDTTLNIHVHINIYIYLCKYKAFPYDKHAHMGYPFWVILYEETMT